ncbi:unnamed protein product, partial [Polarella glacialis]
AWNAYLGGRCSRLQSLEAASGEEVLPRNALHTSQAASLLLQVVRSLPDGVLLRRMLEPLTQELMESVYRDWPQLLPSLRDLDESEVAPERLDQLTTYFSLVEGYKARSEHAISFVDATEAKAAAVHAEAQAKTAGFE